ncbi:MAG TPA: hypothetical protein VMF57_20235 [Solirubrobacteraceae bacterium]|nr:hypothetical protein [Solirubrobacteraceae bacterium]
MRRFFKLFPIALLGVFAAVATPLAQGAAPTPPATITARLLKHRPLTAKVGTVVPASGLGQRVFINQRVGFALGAVGQAQYPAKTTDGGAVWKTFGPALHENAAQAPLAVTEIGVANARTVYFYGSGQVVDVTSDGGKQWWQAFSQELSVAVVPGIGRRLLWFTQDSFGANGTNAVTWPYVSTDGGRVWHYTTALGGGF